MGGAGLYVHVPFCRRKCLYCSFVSFPLPAAGAEASPDCCNGYGVPDVPAYLAALQREMAVLAQRPDVRLTRFSSIYIGGGTPTVLAPEQLAAVLSWARQLAGVTGTGVTGTGVTGTGVTGTGVDGTGLDRRREQVAGMEITVEANPGTLTPRHLQVLKEAGVNRLSLGVQSFHDHELKVLGRLHTADEARQSFALAREAGFDNINIDLMFGIPGQSETSFYQSLQAALRLHPEHLSCYGLTVEEGTPLESLLQAGEYILPGEEAELAQFHLARQLLTAAGYIHYEISNYARPGRECRHNMLYWHLEPYLGVGLGAHSYWGGRRLANPDRLEIYCRLVTGKGCPAECEREADPAADMDEAMFLGLRTLAGVDDAWFAKRFGHSLFNIYNDAIERLVDKGLVYIAGQRLRLSERGLPLANQVFVEFLRA